MKKSGTQLGARCSLRLRTETLGARDELLQEIGPNKKSLHRQLGGGGRCRAGFKWRYAGSTRPVDPKVNSLLASVRNAQP